MSIMRTAIITVSIKICSIFTSIYLIWYTLRHFLFWISGYKARFDCLNHLDEKSCNISSNSFKFITWIKNSSRSYTTTLMDFITFSEKIEMSVNPVFHHEIFPTNLVLLPFISIFNSIEELIESIFWSIRTYKFIHN